MNKTLNLNAYGVMELNQQEMMAIEGGSFKEVLCEIGNVIKVIGEAIKAVGDWVIEQCCG
ncbi:MAG: hypothetical protein LBV69_11425 [Bacteroidales bacterium]|jgi:hypothetical protein|nr:hypothetical protein [Bacteroidales bacterium]